MEPKQFTAEMVRVGDERHAWTMIHIPIEVTQWFGKTGYVKVKGHIDGHAIRLNLMPVGDGRHWLPVKESIRKAIGKNAGAIVSVVLEPDTDGLTIPEDFAATLDLIPEAKVFFESLTESQQSYFVKSIQEAKVLATRHSRIEKCIDKLVARKKFYDV